jgi:hypothetical protein
MMLSCCIIRGRRRCDGRDGGERFRPPSKWFDSETTRRDFSNTFHSLMVLSKYSQDRGNRRPSNKKSQNSRAVTDESRMVRTICREEEMGGVLSSAPLDLVDLLLYFQRLEVIELGFMRLKFCVELVLASLFLRK